MLDAVETSHPRGVWYWMVCVLLVGYICMGRSFAYWGVPPWHLFIGEVALACFLLSGPLLGAERWPWMAAKNPTLHRFNWILLILLSYGVFQILHGILAGYPPLSAVRDLAFNYYPIYFFLGIWVTLDDPTFLPKLLRLVGWANGIYGLVYILFLSRLPWFYPGVSQEVERVPIFGQPLFSGAIVLALLSVSKDMRGQWLPLVLNIAVLLGMVTRGEWLAFGVGLVVWAWLTKNLGRLALGGALVVALLVAMYLTGFSIEAPEGRGGTISASDLVGRIIAPVDKDLAAEYTSDAQANEETVAFRTLWWIAIWDSVHDNGMRSLFGYGYGYALGDLVPYLAGSFIRTPHNVFFYALGYTGWIGVAIFGLLLAEIGKLSWRVYARSGQPFALVFLVTAFVCALFTAFFETPYGAIPFYVITGCACAPLLRERGRTTAPVRRPAHPQILRPLPGVSG